MAPTARSRRLFPQAVLWIAVPLGLVLAGAIVAGTLAYQRVVTSLLIDRDRQLASLLAEQIGQALGDQALVLHTALEASPVLEEEAVGSLELEPAISDRFAAGVVVTDRFGMPRAASPVGWQPSNRPIFTLAPFQSAITAERPAFSDILQDPTTQQSMIVLAIGLYEDDGRFVGVALGGMPLDTFTVAESIRGLSESHEEFAYLVDGSGRAIFHPDPQLLGQDLSDRPFVSEVISGRTGGMVWTSGSGERLVQGYAPVPGTAWGLIVREPWEVVVEPVGAYGAVMAAASIVILGTAALLLGAGVRRITRPISQLAAQIPRLAGGNRIQSPPSSGVEEIDTLFQSFERIADQLASYRAGLRSYLDAITLSQEDERRRIARELHDDTTQNLLAIQRKLELQQARTTDPELRQALGQLQEMLEETARGVREISLDLRPIILEDLGLVPALRALIKPDGGEAAWNAALRVQGLSAQLDPDLELALYRIAQESLSNIRKHADANSVLVSLVLDSEKLTVSIQDDGKGFEPPGSLALLAQQGSFGLMGIQERAWAIGGRLEIVSNPGSGTRIEVSIPAGMVAPRSGRAAPASEPRD